MRAPIWLAPALLLAACSIPSKHFDNGSIDAPPGTPDSRQDGPMTDAQVFPIAPAFGFAGVLDTTVIDSDAKALGVTGGFVNIQFTTQPGGELVYGISALSGCTVTRYTKTSHPPAPLVDAGTITVTGNALVHPMQPCNFGVSQQPYDCVTVSAPGQTVSTVNSTIPFFSAPGFTLPPTNLLGQWLEVSGLSNPALNGRFPICTLIDIDADGKTDIGVALAPLPTMVTNEVATTYRILNGAGPVPAGPNACNFNADFLQTIVGGAQSSLQIAKVSGSNWPAFDVTLPARGQGFALSTDPSMSDDPTAFPTTATRDLKFGCDAATCGAEVTPASGQLAATIVFGSTTDAAPAAGDPNFKMPPPVNQWTTFQCASLSGNSVTMPKDAVAAILGTSPKMIEVSVVRAVVKSIPDAANDVNSGFVAAGHAVVGHTKF